MKRIFLDTVGLLAAANDRDALHHRAAGILADAKAMRSPMTTSEWVLAEFLGGASRQPLRRAAIRIVDRLRRSRRTEIVPASKEGWAEAYELYKARADKEWSLVDCSSILICHRRAITDVLTADHHFAQAGLNVLIQRA